jgi:hypothetical protein
VPAAQVVHDALLSPELKLPAVHTPHRRSREAVGVWVTKVPAPQVDTPVQLVWPSVSA